MTTELLETQKLKGAHRRLLILTINQLRLASEPVIENWNND